MPHQRRSKSRVSGRALPHLTMMSHSIISDAQALQILQNDLRKRALERHAAELKDATPERRSEISAEIEREIQKQLRKRATRVDPGTLLR